MSSGERLRLICPSLATLSKRALTELGRFGYGDKVLIQSRTDRRIQGPA